MVQRAATHIAKKAVEMDIVPGRSPISVAAAAIYMASQVCRGVSFPSESFHCPVISIELIAKLGVVCGICVLFAEGFGT